MTAPEVIKKKARKLFENGSHSESLDLCLRLIEMEPEDPGHYLKAVTNYRALSRPQEALVASLKAVSLDPGNPMAHCVCGMVYSDMGDIDEAIASFDNSIGLNPSNPTTRILRGSEHAKRGLDEASVYIAHLERGDSHAAARSRRRVVADLKRCISDYSSGREFEGESDNLGDTIRSMAAFIADLDDGASASRLSEQTVILGQAIQDV